MSPQLARRKLTCTAAKFYNKRLPGVPHPLKSVETPLTEEDYHLSIGCQLTERDTEILAALATRIRVLTVDQIARTWWQDSRDSTDNARKRLRVLSAGGWLSIHRLPAHPELRLSEPAFTWELQEPPPDSGALAYRLQRRWAEHLTLTSFATATAKCARRFDGRARPPRQVERTHDIHVAAIYLLYRARDPHVLTGWISEDVLRAEHRRDSERIPDAILRLGHRKRAIEFGGAYPKAKIEAFHRYCEEAELSYEIW